MDSTGGPGAPFAAHSITPVGDEPGRISDEAGRGNGNERHSLAPQIVALLAENQELRAEVERLRADRTRMVDLQKRLMEAIGSKSPDRLVHDVRNVLNERELYRALADATV